MNKKVIANWKMFGEKKKVKTFMESLITLFTESPANNIEIITCFPFLYLMLAKNYETSYLKVGAQNCHQGEEGPYTGEISCSMLADIGCSYTIVGHSERRQFYGETNEIVKLKACSALQHNITPIICVGEAQSEDKSQLIYQLKQSIPSDNTNFIVAYEPIYAIGKNLATLNYAKIEESINSLKDILPNCQLLYGGSVKVEHIDKLLSIAALSGILVGNASLTSLSFSTIIKQVMSKF